MSTRSAWTINGRHFTETRTERGGHRYFIDGKPTRWQEWGRAMAAARAAEPATEAKFEAFIASIPNIEKPGTCDLRTCIRDSAIVNANDTPSEPFWEMALATAQMIADDWKSYYPELA